jgi:hypothetical protein
VKPLHDDLDALAELCGGELVVTPRGTLTLEGEAEPLSLVEIGCSGGEWVEVGIGDALVRVGFAGWIERLELGDDPEDRDEGAALALDFVAAALFGELRVIEDRLEARVLRRRLEVCVGGRWRTHASRGRLGLAGALAQLRGRIDRRSRSNEGRLRRPKSLRDAGPSGQPGLPWSGAAHDERLAAHNQAAELAIDGELDLHNFPPKEVGPLVREYIGVCQARGVRDLRIVHGKGKGVLRRTVHAVLREHPAVESHRLGGHGEGSWGATIVRLRE